MPALARRSALARPVAACLAVAAVSVFQRSLRVDEPAFTYSRGNGPAPFAGQTAAAGGGRGGVPVNFFDKIQEALGFADPEKTAASALADMASASKKQVAKDQKDLKAKRAATREAMASLKAGMTELYAAKEEALQACEVKWDSDESTWDDDLKSCAEPVLTQAAKAAKALTSLETSTATLLAACDSAEEAVKNRTVAAEALVADLDDEAKERLAKDLQQAIQPISDGEALRQWVLAKAEVVDGKREFAESEEDAKLDGEAFTGTLREKRAARCKAEVAAAEAKAAEEAKAKAAAEAKTAAAATPAASSSSEDSDGPSPLILVGLAAVAAGAYYFSQGGTAPKVSMPAPTPTAVVKSVPAPAPKIEAPKIEVPKIEAPKIEIEAPKIEMPKIEVPAFKAPTPAPEAPLQKQLLPREEATKNSEDSLKVKTEKGELLGMLK